MIRKEALKILKECCDKGFNRTTYTYDEYVTARDMAIKALEQEPCEDCISRKSIKQKLQKHHDFFINAYGGFSNLSLPDKSRVDEITNCIAMVVNEPPVNPQPKTGHWISHREHCEMNNLIPSGLGSYFWCSECDCGIDAKEWHMNNYNYCPNCGARMSESKYYAELSKSFVQGLQNGFSESEENE